MTDREQLAARIEAAGVDEQRAMLGEAFAYIHKMDDGLAPADWSALNWPFADRFTAMLDAGAYLDAAMMLVPSHWSAADIACTFENAMEAIIVANGDPRKDLARYIAAAAIRAGGA